MEIRESNIFICERFPLLDVTLALLPRSISSGVVGRLGISGARTNGKAIIRTSLRDDKCLLQLNHFGLKAGGLFHTSLGSAVEKLV